MTLEYYPYTVNLIVGDWSHDGHNQTHKITISSNLSSKGIEKAQAKGAKAMGFDIRDYCQNYEDSHIPWDFVRLLHSQGFQFMDEDFWDSEEDEDESPGIDCEDYGLIYLHQTKIGDPSFKFEVVNGADIHVGGYGCFS